MCLSTRSTLCMYVLTHWRDGRGCDRRAPCAPRRSGATPWRDPGGAATRASAPPESPARPTCRPNSGHALCHGRKAPWLIHVLSQDMLFAFALPAQKQPPPPPPPKWEFEMLSKTPLGGNTPEKLDVAAQTTSRAWRVLSLLTTIFCDICSDEVSR